MATKEELEQQKEVVMEELRKLPNLDSTIFTGVSRYSTYTITIESPKEKYAIEHGTKEKLVHSLRALQLTGLEGSIENIEKGVKVFGMLQSIYAYSRGSSAEQMASRDIFNDKMYNLGYENVLIMAKYLISNTSKIEEDVYTDCEGCSYNSLCLVEV